MRAGTRVAVLAALVAAACSSPEPSLRVVSPRDGAEVTSPVLVVVEVEGFELGTAGGFAEGKAHLHVLVDVGCVPAGRTIPSGPAYVHLWRGGSRARLDLEPGPHALCVQAGDGTHVAMDVRREIRVTVVGVAAP
jgi:hypothetical protein